MDRQTDGFKFIVAVGVSIAFWTFMASIAETHIGAFAGFIIAFGLAMVVGPLLILGPIGPLVGLAALVAYAGALRKKASDWGPIVVVNVIGFIVFAYKSVMALDRAWP